MFCFFLRDWYAWFELSLEAILPRGRSVVATPPFELNQKFSDEKLLFHVLSHSNAKIAAKFCSKRSILRPVKRLLETL